MFAFEMKAFPVHTKLLRWKWCDEEKQMTAKYEAEPLM